jgi:hypothetical protein
MRSPGLYTMILLGLDWWAFEQPRARERDGVVVRVEGMVYDGYAG